MLLASDRAEVRVGGNVTRWKAIGAPDGRGGLQIERGKGGKPAFGGHRGVLTSKRGDLTEEKGGGGGGDRVGGGGTVWLQRRDRRGPGRGLPTGALNGPPGSAVIHALSRA